VTLALLSPESPDPEHRKPAPRPERLEWLRLKAEADREAKAKRLVKAAKRKPLSACKPSIRAYREAQHALADLHRNRRRWEEA
jgi:hypothetical protein